MRSNTVAEDVALYGIIKHVATRMMKTKENVNMEVTLHHRSGPSGYNDDWIRDNIRQFQSMFLDGDDVVLDTAFSSGRLRLNTIPKV